jgi:hypothetical protein
VESLCKCSFVPAARPGGAGWVCAPAAVTITGSIIGVSISILGGARCVVGRIGTRGISIVGTGVSVGNETLSDNMALVVWEVWNWRDRMGDFDFDGEEGAEEIVTAFLGELAVSTDAGAIVETLRD